MAAGRRALWKSPTTTLAHDHITREDVAVERPYRLIVRRPVLWPLLDEGIHELEERAVRAAGSMPLARRRRRSWRATLMACVLDSLVSCATSAAGLSTSTFLMKGDVGRWVR